MKFQEYDCIVKFSHYTNGRNAIMLFDKRTGEAIATATVNLPDADLEDDEIAIKNWSENEGMLEALQYAGMVFPAHRYIPSGFVQVPICTLIVRPDMFMKAPVVSPEATE